MVTACAIEESKALDSHHTQICSKHIKGSKECLFITTQTHGLQIFGVIGKLQNTWLKTMISEITCVMVRSGQRTMTQAAESIKWRPQQAYGSNQFLLVQPQTVFSTHTKSSRSRIDKRTARATGNTRYRYSKIAPLDHKMADNCVSLARTNTLSSTITKLIKTSKTSNKSYSYSLLNCINKMYTHDLFYLQQEWEAWLAPVYIQIRTTKSQLTQCTKYNCH